MFSIGQDDGIVIVDYKGDNVLDRDRGTKSFTITFRAADNFYQTGRQLLPHTFRSNFITYIDFSGGSQNSNEDNFDIILLDINDQYPKILNTSITVMENMKAVGVCNNFEKSVNVNFKGDEVEAVLYAFDEDEPNTDNTKIEFSVIGIFQEDDSEIEQLFEVSTDEQYESGVGRLKVVKDLKGYYGTYTLVVRVS